MHNKTMRGGRNIETVEGALEVARADDNAHAGDPNWTGSYVGEGVVISNNVGIDFERRVVILRLKDRPKPIFETGNCRELLAM